MTDSVMCQDCSLAPGTYDPGRHQCSYNVCITCRRPWRDCCYASDVTGTAARLMRMLDGPAYTNLQLSPSRIEGDYSLPAGSQAYSRPNPLPRRLLSLILSENIAPGRVAFNSVLSLEASSNQPKYA